MTYLKRLIVLAVVVIIGVTTRMVVRYGVDGALDLLLNAAHAQTTESELSANGKPRAHRPPAAHAAVPAGAVQPGQPALTPAAPISAGPINAARKAVAAENAQLAAQTGQPVPQTKTSDTRQATAPSAQAATPVTQQGAPKSVATKAETKSDTAKHAPVAPNATPNAGTTVAAGGKAATAPNGKAAPPAGAAAGSPGSTPTAATATAKPDAKTAGAQPAVDTAKSLVTRETFEYHRDARRDPFLSLMTTSDLRPTITDLTLKGVLYDLSGRRPIAILRDQTGGQWRVTTGMTLGRMRVAQIKPRAVIFTIEEFGFSRQDSLLLGDTTRVRSR